MIPTTTKKSRVIGIPTALALGVFAPGAGVASASTHPAKTSRARTTVTATSVTSRANQGGVGEMSGTCGGVGGDVTALTSSDITVINHEGTSTIYAITSTTTVTKDRQSATLAAVALGENVHIIVSSSDATNAASIAIVPANIGGNVTAVRGDTISVTGPNGETGTIVVNGSTTYAEFGATSSLSDVTVGSFVFAEGTFAATATTVDAAYVGNGQVTPGNGPGPGAFQAGGPGDTAFMGAGTPPSS